MKIKTQIICRIFNIKNMLNQTNKMNTIFLLIIVVIGWGLFHNFSRMATHYLPVPAMQIVAGICWTLTLPLYFFLLHRTPEYKWNVPGIAWCVAAFLATNIGTFAYMYVLSKNNVSSVVGYATTYPIVVMIVATVFMGEAFSLMKFFGLLLILTGVFVSSR